jgi:hypothetical protein
LKRAVSVSLGTSKRDKTARVEFDGAVVELSRFGTDGDLTRAHRLFVELDGKVDALGLGGFELYVRVQHRRYPLRPGVKLIRGVTKTPVVDGGVLKQTLERRTFRLAEKDLGGSPRFRRALVAAGVDRYGLAEAVSEVCDEVLFADFYFGLGLPIPVRRLRTLTRTARVVMPIVGLLPASFIYPIGKEQETSKPRFPRLWHGIDLVAGDFHYIRSELPERLDGITIVTNTTTEADVQLFRERGAKCLITTTPRFGGRSFGTNALEAAMTAASGLGRGLDEAELNAMIDRCGLRPEVLRLQG